MNRAQLEALISAAVTFFGVLLAVAFAIGVSSRGALKGPDAFVLRWTAISLMVAFSALVAWVRWRFFLRPRLSSTPAATVAGSGPAERRQTAGPQALNPPPAAPGPSPDILAASGQAIVFRQHFPPPHRDSALSFFGGAPVAPRDFRWPRPEGSRCAIEAVQFPDADRLLRGARACSPWNAPGSRCVVFLSRPDVGTAGGLPRPLCGRRRQRLAHDRTSDRSRPRLRRSSEIRLAVDARYFISPTAVGHDQCSRQTWHTGGHRGLWLSPRQSVSRPQRPLVGRPIPRDRTVERSSDILVLRAR
jgi:hypothetical protein